jgi:hypothetical protein
MQKCRHCKKKTIKSDCLRNKDQQPVVQFDHCITCKRVVRHVVYRHDEFGEIGGVKGLEEAINDGL